MRPSAFWLLPVVVCLGSGVSSARKKKTPSSSDLGESGSFQVHPTLGREGGEREATVLSYFMADDNGHQTTHSGRMLAMMSRLDQPNVHSVVMRDGSKPNDTRLYYVRGKHRRAGAGRWSSSKLAPKVGEAQSNSPALLRQIVDHTFSRYKGRGKYLQVYTHGGGVLGIGTDSTQTTPAGVPLTEEQQRKVMSPAEFGQALRAGLKGRKLDGIYLRSCLMGNLEALYELRDVVRYAVASEDVSSSVKNSNLTMTRAFQEMAGQGLKAAEVARRLSILGHAKTGRLKDGQSSGYRTLMAADLGRLKDVKSAINSLVVQMRAAGSQARSEILQAYDSVPDFSFSAGEHGMRDLWAFTSAIDKHVTSPGVREASARLRQAQRRFTLHEADAYGSAANGLSIFMPKRQGLAEQMKKVGYASTRFARETGWDEFLSSIAEP